MFKWYGLTGILIIILVEINFFLRIQPLASWYFPIIWLGYILVIDAVNKKISGKSLISDNRNKFFGILIISALFWWVFEFTNLSVRNWNYINLINELIRNIHLFDKLRLKRKHNITKKFLHTMMIIGAACLILPVLFPQFAFPLIWLSFYFILDPINYIHKQPSIIKHLKDKKLAIPLSLLLAGIIMGFFWEFWNFYALPKWTYNVPFVSFFKIFEMPLLGYLGYFPFAFELYVMYFFVESLFLKKERLLVK